MRVYSWVKIDKTKQAQGPSRSVLYFDIPAQGEGDAYKDYLTWTRDTTARPGRTVQEGRPFRLQIQKGDSLQSADWPWFDTADSGLGNLGSGGHKASTASASTGKSNDWTDDRALRARVDSLAAKYSTPEVLRAHFSARQLKGENLNRQSVEPAIDLAHDVKVLSVRVGHPVLDGDSSFAVAMLLSLGQEMGAICLVVRRSDNETVAFSDETFQLAEPFHGGPVTAVMDFSGDGLPDVAYECFSGRSWQMRIYRWDGDSRLTLMRRHIHDSTSIPWFVGQYGVGSQDVDGDGVPEVSTTSFSPDPAYTEVTRYWKWDGREYLVYMERFFHPDSTSTTLVYPEQSASEKKHD